MKKLLSILLCAAAIVATFGCAPEIEKLDKNRIEKVHVYLPEKDPETRDNTES